MGHIDIYTNIPMKIDLMFILVLKWYFVQFEKIFLAKT